MIFSKIAKTHVIKTYTYRKRAIALGSIILALVIPSYYLHQTNATESDYKQIRGIPTEDSRRFSKGRIKVTNSEKDCLKEALWYEARGTSKKEQELVADVIINRAKVNSSSICKEISRGFQFSYRNQGSVPAPSASNKIDKEALDGIQKVVNNKIVVNNSSVHYSVHYRSSLPLKVQYYARKDIKNYWTRAKKQIKIASNLKHNFYY